MPSWRLMLTVSLLVLIVNTAVAANVLSWKSADVDDDQITLNFNITWKRNYKLITENEKGFAYLDFPRVTVKKTKLVKFIDNAFIKKVKLGQFTDDIARIVVYFNGEPERFQYNSFFKVVGNKTNFIITIRKKDTIGDIIKEHSFSIMIDPGHGGVDPGCVSPRGFREKNVVLSLAGEIKKEFEKRNLGIVLMTRGEDVFLSLDERIKMAAESKASLFVSLHVDTLPSSKSVRGAGIYYLSQRGASDKRTEILAQKENTTDAIGGVKLSDNQELFRILFSLKQTEAIKRSATFSGILEESLKDSRIRTHGIRQADFRVLKIPDMPAVLLEAGFFSNKYDERLLVNDSYIVRMAQAVVDAIEDYKINWWKKRF